MTYRLTSIALLALSTSAIRQAPVVKPIVDEKYSSFGMIVGRAGDVNLDGIPDFVVGDSDMPQFWILSGKDGSVLHHVQLLVDYKYAGYRVDGGSDVDGDGVPDVLIAAQPYAPDRIGALYIVSGKTGRLLRTIPTHGVGGPHGDWAHFVSDIDHDGTPDVGAFNPRSGEPSDPKSGATKEPHDLVSKDSDRIDKHDAPTGHGTLSIFSGKSGALLMEIAVDNECNSPVGGFVEAGDVDGDGTSDFAVTIDGCKQSSSSLRLYSGAKKNVLWQHPGRSNCCAFAMLCVVGDLDHDGVRELAVSFRDEVHVVSGKTGEPRFRFEPKEESDSERGYGWALAPLGDIDGDGFPDLAFSETEAGAWCGSIYALSGKDGVDLWESKGCSVGDVHYLGHQLATIGDVDGDHVSDLVVGSWEGSSGARGLARVISGKTGTVIFELTRTGADVIVSKNPPKTATPR